MRSTTTRTRLLAAGLAAGMLLALPGVASAQTEPATTDTTTVQQARPAPQIDVDTARRRLIAAIDRRLKTIERLTNAVTGNDHITPGHEARLLADYARAASGLRAARADAEAATTLDELKQIGHHVVVDFRIYLVVAPKSHEVLASDTVVDAADRMDGIADELAAAIGRAEEAGYDVTEARKWLTVARDEIGEGRRAGGPVAGDVIGLQAADYPDPAKGALTTGKRRLEDARLDLRQAKVSLHKSYQALKDAVGTPPEA